MNEQQVPTLANGFRFQWEPAQKSHVLLYPEGMKVLSESAAEIVTLMDGKNSIAAIVIALEKKFPDVDLKGCLLYTSPSPRDLSTSRMPSSA